MDLGESDKKHSMCCIVVKPVVAIVSGWALQSDSDPVQAAQKRYPKLSGRPDDGRNACGNLAIPFRIDKQIEVRLGSGDFARLTELVRGS
jgi:hypothetical protein